MKFAKVLLISSLVLNIYAQGPKNVVDCKATKVVDSSVLEESLSVHEYPEVKITRDESGIVNVWLGASLYKSEAGDQITPQPTFGFNQNYEITPSHGYEQFSVRTSMKRTRKGMKRTGTVLARTRQEKDEKFGEWILLAELACKN